jgi:TolB-like protein/Tfp pilus assembly protein PilF
MPTEQSAGVKFEVAHVLFIDIVCYSKLLIDEQSEALQELNQIVRTTEAARAAESAGQLIILPTGDGMALVFTSSVEQPVECALQISQTLRAQPSLPVRMGIHSGPVHHVLDANQRENIAGAGINIAQRVMDCGDAGHILVSKRVADDLAQYRRWQPYLHEVGDVEAKHGVIVSVVNLYADVVGNPAPPAKFKGVGAAVSAAKQPKPKQRMPWHEVVLAAMVLIGLIAAGTFLFHHRAPQQANTAATSASPPATAAAAVPEKSLAVLPFENLSEDKANEFFTNGVQDEILSHLSKVADLKVISRTSVMQYKTGAPRNLREIGQQLAVAHLVEGSVQRAGNKVRVIAQLIDARNDAHLWAQTYDRDLADVFAIQTEIAKSIADQLQAKLSPAEKSAIEQRPTANLTAFDEYSRAKTLILTSSATLTDKNILQAVELLNGAVARDPSFHAAFCELVTAHGQLYSIYGDHTPARLAAAEAALQHATQLRPDAPETHLARGAHLYYAFRDYKGALSEMAAARAGLPNDPRILEFTGYILRRQGKPEEGLRALEKSVALDPRNPATLAQLALSYQGLRRYPETKATVQRVVEIIPDDVTQAVGVPHTDLLWRADTQPLHQFIERLQTERPTALAEIADAWFFCALAERDWGAAQHALTSSGNNPCGYDNGIIFSRQFGEGLLARAMHDNGRARKAFTAARLEQEQVVQQQKDYGPPLCTLALIDAALGNKDAALQEGRHAMELLPREKDATNGDLLVGWFAVVAAWTGEKDLALQQLHTAIPLPGAATYIASYGVLKLMPFWDPLRGDQRFEKIVASLAPKG